MNIYVNGEKMLVADSASLADVLFLLNEKIETLAIELNSEIVDRLSLKKSSLKEGDRIELIRYMSGG